MYIYDTGASPRKPGGRIKKREIRPQYQGRPVNVVKKIACCPNGDMVIAELHLYRVYLLGWDGKCKVQLNSPEADKQKQIGLCYGIVVSTAYILILDNTKFIKVFQQDGRYYSCFSNGYDNRLIAINGDQRVLLADLNNNTMTFHTCPDGRLIKTIKYDVGPVVLYGSIVVNSRNQILHHFLPRDSVYSKVVATDYSGRQVFAFTPRIDEDLTGRKVWPRGIACDTYDNIYIVMCVEDGFIVRLHTGHLHKYSATGAFLGCLAKGLSDPWDLSITHDNTSLVIANWDAILIFPI